MKFEIVSHCWRYYRLLTYQLSSLVLYPPSQMQVTMTVFAAEEDEGTNRVMDFFQQRGLPETLTIRRWYLPAGQLMLRIIGRNLAALTTEADWIWFTDCDYVFGDGALDAFPKAVETVESPLVFPRCVYLSKTHDEGDRAIDVAVGQPRLMQVQPEDFARARSRRAIGGIQIARGDRVREIGYCKDSWLHRRRSNRWRRTREDPYFRRSLGTRGSPIDLPNIYRIRHSLRGRTHVGVEL